MKPCPICAEWKYRQLVSVCPICGKPGGLAEVEDLAAEYLRQLEVEKIKAYAKDFDQKENVRLRKEGFFPRKFEGFDSLTIS